MVFTMPLWCKGVCMRVCEMNTSNVNVVYGMQCRRTVHNLRVCQSCVVTRQCCVWVTDWWPLRDWLLVLDQQQCSCICLPLHHSHPHREGERSRILGLAVFALHPGAGGACRIPVKGEGLQTNDSTKDIISGDNCVWFLFFFFCLKSNLEIVQWSGSVKTWQFSQSEGLIFPVWSFFRHWKQFCGAAVL